MSQDDPAQQPTAGGAPDKQRRPTLARRLGALWSVPTYRFALVFFGFLVSLALIYPGLRTRFPSAFGLTETVTAQLAYRLLSCFSSEASLTNGNTIFFGRFPVEIIEECSGIYEAMLLGAALLAFPTSWYKTALGFAIGFPLIYAMNIVRIAALLVIGRYFPNSFNFLHLYFWQGTMIAMVASTWLIWVLWVVRGGRVPGSPGSASP